MTKSKTGFWIDLIFVSVFFVFSAFEPPLWAHESSFCINLLFPENLEKPDDRSHWRLQYYKGTPAVQFEGTGEKKDASIKGFAVTIAFGLKRKVDIDTAVFPLMEWHWKADKWGGGDVRRADCDDQALELYVIFPSLGFPGPAEISYDRLYVGHGSAKGFLGPSPQGTLAYGDPCFAQQARLP